jgi:hypothetical protein
VERYWLLYFLRPVSHAFAVFLPWVAVRTHQSIQDKDEKLARQLLQYEDEKLARQLQYEDEKLARQLQYEDKKIANQLQYEDKKIARQLLQDAHNANTS